MESISHFSRKKVYFLLTLPGFQVMQALIADMGIVSQVIAPWSGNSSKIFWRRLKATFSPATRRGLTTLKRATCRHYFKGEPALNTLVTGGAGYIGGTVAKLLMAAGHQPTIYDNFSHSRRSAVPAGAELVEGDVQDQQKLELVLRERKIDAVLHFAALIEAGESMKKPELYFSNNTAATLNLLQ